MKFLISHDGTGAICNACTKLFRLPRIVPEMETRITCPDCGEKATYWIEWFVNEIEEEEV